MQNHLTKANLAQVFVEREKRDKGIGTQLVEGALQEATKLGFAQLYGYAENDSPQLVNFYKNLGFTIETGNQPTSIFGDIPGTVVNTRTGGVFFSDPSGRKVRSFLKKNSLLKERHFPCAFARHSEIYSNSKTVDNCD